MTYYHNNNLSNDFLAKSERLSKLCEESERVYAAMKRIMKVTIQLEHKINIADTMNELNKYNIGTNKVEDTCRKLINDERKNRKLVDI